MIPGLSRQNSSSRSPEAIFVSHATEDKDFVQTLVEHLAQKGFETWHQKEMAPWRQLHVGNRRQTG